MHNAPLYSYLYELTFGINLYSGTFPLTFLKTKKSKKKKTIARENFLKRKITSVHHRFFRLTRNFNIFFLFAHRASLCQKSNNAQRKLKILAHLHFIFNSKRIVPYTYTQSTIVKNKTTSSKS